MAEPTTSKYESVKKSLEPVNFSKGFIVRRRFEFFGAELFGAMEVKTIV